MRLELGDPVHCADGLFGELVDVVVDPNGLRVTHLVVAPQGEQGQARLAPIERVSADGGRITLDCPLADAHELPDVEQYSYLRLGERLPDDPDWDVGIETVLTIDQSTGYGGFDGAIGYDQSYGVTYHRVPSGEVEIRRHSQVTSADDEHLGHVDGFLVDPTGAVTHLVLERGHLWGRRDVTIPVESITRVANDAVTLGLTKDEVGALPSVRPGSEADG